jgi:gamma-glutamyltranspeptidase / glutathione hydrolase
MRPIVGLIFSLASVTTMAADRITGAEFATRSEVIAPHAMAATSHPLATQIALEVMRGGGNAIDAAIAANAALGLMEPTGNGIGGDLFAIVWDAKSQKLLGLNGSGRAPKSLSLKEFKRRGLTDIPALGPLPVSVPGCVDGWITLHQRLGKLPLAQVLAPTVRYARDGFPVSEVVAYYWALSVPRLSPFPGFKEQFTIDGRAPRKGELWRNPNLGDLLERIGRDGRKAFYEGQTARTIAAYIKAQGGFLSEADLAAHTSTWVDPVSTSYRGVEVWELPPNGQGIAALQMLNILEGFDFSKIPFGSPEHIHRFVEAKKLAFADRAKFYADPDFSTQPIAELIGKPYAERQRARIDLKRAARQVDAGQPGSSDTIYLATADRDGNMVSLIQSNYRGMGSGMTPPGLGFILQNRGEMFVLQEGHANTFEPGKRPFQTIIPAFATRNGKPWLAFGVMGGDMQPQGHVQIIQNLVDFGMNLQESGDAPRIYHTGSTEPTGQATPMTDGGELALERGFGYATERALLRMGHRLVPADGPFGGYQAILRDPESGVYFGASESRKDGHAAGF